MNLAMFIRIDATPSFGDAMIRLSASVVDRDNELRSFSDYGEGAEYHGLVVEGHISTDFARDDFLMHGNYDSPFSYDMHRVSQRDAERMVKMFRTLARRFVKIRDEQGYAVDSAMVLGQAAQALKIKGPQFVWRATPSRGFQPYDPADYRFADVESLRFHLRHEVSEWQKKHNIPTGADKTVADLQRLAEGRNT